MDHLSWIILVVTCSCSLAYVLFFKREDVKKRRWSRKLPKTIDFIGLKNKEKLKND